MKKLSISFVLLGTLLNAQVATFPWTESFEDASPTLSQWTQVQVTGSLSWGTESSYYAYTPTTPYAGSMMAKFTCTSFDGYTTKYISPVLNLSGATTATLEFKFRNRVWGSDQNILKVYYRTSSSGAWTLLQTYDTNITDWTSSGILNLPNTSATYQIALEGVAYYGYNINVDEVVVAAQNLATQESVKKESLSIYPNPATDVINLKSNQTITEITIYDAIGKIVLNSKESGNQIKVSHLLPGIYILQTKDRSGNVNREKFIKK